MATKCVCVCIKVGPQSYSKAKADQGTPILPFAVGGRKGGGLVMTMQMIQLKDGRQRKKRREKRKERKEKVRLSRELPSSSLNVQEENVPSCFSALLFIRQRRRSEDRHSTRLPSCDQIWRFPVSSRMFSRNSIFLVTIQKTITMINLKYSNKLLIITFSTQYYASSITS